MKRQAPRPRKQRKATATDLAVPRGERGSVRGGGHVEFEWKIEEGESAKRPLGLKQR